MNYNRNLEYIFNHYGANNQATQLIQECAELIVALTKNNGDNIIEEMADVSVLIEQFMTAYPELKSKINHIKTYKVERQMLHIMQHK